MLAKKDKRRKNNKSYDRSSKSEVPYFSSRMTQKR